MDLTLHASLESRYLEIFRRVKVLPILTLDDAALAVPLARALAAGGLSAMELTLRTPAALEGIRRIASEVPEVIIGAGSVNTPARVQAAVQAGAQFLVTPGSPPSLVDALLASGLPAFPGAVTPTEVMVLLERGFRYQKFFPAEGMGGLVTLKALAGPLPEVRFCPTGGIDAQCARLYLQLHNVIMVGGAWMAPESAWRAQDWATITELARHAAQLQPQSG